MPVDFYAQYNSLDPQQTEKMANSLPKAVQNSIVREVPTTVRHPPPADLEKFIPNPGMPVANRAISKENPHGSDKSPPNATVLQQHVQFWDFDGDGVIYPWDTYNGFRKLGFNPILSGIAPLVIHGTFSYPTSHTWIPNPLMPINIDRMNRTKHGSDSETYDTEGRFVPQKFEEIFSKYDRENKGGLSWRDIQEMVYNNMNVNDPVGWIAERLEWWTTYLLFKDERGIVTKEKIRGMYDGSIWETVAAEVEAKRAARRGNKGVSAATSKKSAAFSKKPIESPLNSDAPEWAPEPAAAGNDLQLPQSNFKPTVVGNHVVTPTGNYMQQINDKPLPEFKKNM